MTQEDLAPGEKNMHGTIAMVTDDGTVMMTLWLWSWSKEMIGLALAVSATLSLSGKDVNCNFSNHTTDLMTIETDLSILRVKSSSNQEVRVKIFQQ